jgi:opacity protein-like surface antigen
MVLLALMPGARAVAQEEHPIDQVRANARSHVGPFYITPSLLIRDLGIDSNVFNQAEEPRPDFTFTVGPKVDVAVPLARRALLKVTTGADLVYYQKYSSERSVNPSVVPRAELYLNKVTLFAEGSYLRSRQRPNFEIDARSLRTERWVNGGIRYAYSPRFAVDVSGRRADVEFDASETFLDVRLRETLNRESKSVAASLQYALTPKTTLVLRGDATRDRFEFSPSRDADTVRIMPGVEFDSRALIFGTGYVGVRKFDTKSGALEDFQGVVASASLGYTVLGRTMVIFTADRDVTYSFERFQPYYVIDSYGVSVRHKLTGRFDVTAGAGRHQYTYRDLVVEGAPATAGGERVDVTRNLSLSLGYNIGPDVRLGFGTTYWQRESSAARYRDYDAMRTGISLNYGF